MLPLIDRVVFGPAVALWLRFAPDSWHRLPIANDSPHVHAPGTNPDRILVTGDGASAGRGVVTHDLGLPGYLARALSSITGRATDVDVVVGPEMTAKACAEAIDGVKLRRFDAILLSVGAVEALAFTPEKRWERDLTTLLDRIDRDVSDSTVTYAMAIPTFSAHRLFPITLARACDRHAIRLNRVTREVIASRPRTRYVAMRQANAVESASAHAYERWAATVAPRIAEELGVGSGANPRNQVVIETERMAALEALLLLDADLSDDPVFVALLARARNIFGTAFSSITLIDSERQKVVSSSGLPPLDLARDESICDVTIRREAHLAVEDTLLDSRYKDLGIVTSDPHVRFYAGYPIEAPDGHRIGAMCVLDTRPRRFSSADAVLLRHLAQEVQKRLWKLSARAVDARLRGGAVSAPSPAVREVDSTELGQPAGE